MTPLTVRRRHSSHTAAQQSDNRRTAGCGITTRRHMGLLTKAHQDAGRSVRPHVGSTFYYAEQQIILGRAFVICCSA